jgi:hypothetical protein
MVVERLESRRMLSVGVSGTRALGAYHTYPTLTSDLQAYAAAYPSISRLVSVGKSVQNRDLWALRITDNPDAQEDEPELRYIGSMHGDEPVGQEMSLYLIDNLLSGYGVNTRQTDLINGTEIWILPNMNPDGLSLNQRWNFNFVDLNRDFPEGSVNDFGTVYDGPAPEFAVRQPETQAIMNWSIAQSFSLSANFHTGALVANYPYDTNSNGVYDYAATPDDGLFRELALTYSRPNLPMFNNPQFPQGITNGDEWYEVAGGLQDWSYRYTSDNDITVELSNVKKPNVSTLPTLWENNRESMLAYAEAAQWGVRGLVTDAATGQPVYGKVTVQSNSHPVYTDPQVGDYHRLLLPGTYSLTFSAPGYEPRTFSNVVVNSAGTATRLDVTLATVAPPTVTGVFVGSTSWATPFKNFLGTSGAGEAAFGYRIVAADQINELPWTNLNRISIRFSENVNVAADDLVVLGVNVATYGMTANTFAYDASSFTATWTLATSGIVGDKLLLDLDADAGSGVTDLAGNRLDGDWTNPIEGGVSGDSFPSGNGVAGADFQFRINVLSGDVNRSGHVQNNDVTAVRVAQGYGPGASLYSIFSDVNGSGSILGNDVTLVRNQLGAMLPFGERLVLPPRLLAPRGSFIGARSTFIALQPLRADSEVRPLTATLPRAM